ncbi:MocR-like pyridoxine biosynthesis transcription factor PdxR [Propionispora hippei]|uniref:GntR family transcriptional regulator / MocR family aminotransferase n=1 Tax=Propionispora hippei DSM 15287 TaxID=1123003 RepID=A0A1M6BV05_9FIRM|nr:PLP-dependent aminotransferase family protein [Propionispora hippei]SHI52595.1 GntR family transcriptional regulator / MocR family aminotransferase [Propionispora hippei DSM 15287]
MWKIQWQDKKELSLARQIFLSLRERILAGQLAAGERMPSTRELAGSLGVSRNTVCEAYDMLLAEGFTVSRQGAPTRIARDVCLDYRSAGVATAPVKPEADRLLWDFATGRPDVTLFPWKLWSKMLGEAACQLSPGQWGYSSPKGYELLCGEIARWLLRSRGMLVEPADVFITAGATQAFYLLAGLLHKTGAPFVLESPSHPAMYTVITDRGYPVQWLEVDEQGAMIDTLTESAVSAVYVTPSHQFPLGGILPAGRRAALIRLARDNDFYIIEDDYDGEFRYAGPAISPLYSLDASHVIYVGTFSKTLFPALRLGFVILPKPLQEKWRHYRKYMDVQNPVLEQAALTAFLRTRAMDKHIRRMRRCYGEKRSCFLQAVQKHFADSVCPWGDASGLHVALQFPGAEFGERFVEESRAAGLGIRPVNRLCPSLHKQHRDKLLLGYGHLNAGKIQEGMSVLRRLMERGDYGYVTRGS